MDNIQAKNNVKTQGIQQNKNYKYLNLSEQSKLQKELKFLNQNILSRNQYLILSRKSVNFKKFTENNNIITYLGSKDSKSSNPSILVGKQSIALKNIFHIKINNSLNKNIGVGICSQMHHMNEDCIGKNSFILLSLNSNQIITNTKQNQIIPLNQKIKVQNGDEIIVLADLANQRIQWYKNDQKIAKYDFKNKMYCGKTTVPLIRFVDENDSIQWIKQYTFQSRKEKKNSSKQINY